MNINIRAGLVAAFVFALMAIVAATGVGAERPFRKTAIGASVGLAGVTLCFFAAWALVIPTYRSLAHVAFWSSAIISVAALGPHCWFASKLAGSFNQQALLHSGVRPIELRPGKKQSEDDFRLLHLACTGEVDGIELEGETILTASKIAALALVLSFSSGFAIFFASQFCAAASGR